MKNIYTRSYYLAKAILKPILFLLYHPKIENREYIPKEEPAILAGNHTHIFDPGCVAVSTNRQVHFLAKEFLFEYPIIGPLFKKVGCIKVLKDKRNDEALNDAIKTLENNEIIGIFPEGKVKTEDTILNRFRFGAVKMAKKVGCLIVPFAITGKYIPFFGNLRITFGKPIDVREMEVKEATDYLYETVKELIIANQH
ncbi:MAG: lysophospholipid acyltransferase family protein [Erysipelotrichaceae bacterium]|nr:lysophospholipid acyltransferase family protein [Erysipelotrichaceae bacterium]